MAREADYPISFPCTLTLAVLAGRVRMGEHRVRTGGRGFREVEGQQIIDVGVDGALWQFGEDMTQPRQRLDAAGAAGQHQAVDDGAGPGSLDGVAEQPGFPAGGKDSDIAFAKVVVDRHPAVLGEACQIFPLVQGIGDSIAELAVRQDLRGDIVEPFLEGVQDGNAVLLTKAANAVISRFAVIRFFLPRLPFNPVELFEEPEGLLRRPAGFLPRLEGVDKAPSGMGHASKVGGPFQRAPGRIASHS